jgi:hypothetical protein
MSGSWDYYIPIWGFIKSIVKVEIVLMKCRKARKKGLDSPSFTEEWDNMDIAFLSTLISIGGLLIFVNLVVKVLCIGE